METPRLASVSSSKSQTSTSEVQFQNQNLNHSPWPIPGSLSLESECEELRAKNRLLKHQLKEAHKKLLKKAASRRLEFGWQNQIEGKNGNCNELKEKIDVSVKSPKAIYANFGVDNNYKDELDFDVGSTIEHIQNQISTIILERDMLSSEKACLIKILQNQNQNVQSESPEDIDVTDLTNRIAFQQNTIDENYETIQILSETVALMSNYICELEDSRRIDDLSFDLDLGLDQDFQGAVSSPSYNRYQVQYHNSHYYRPSNSVGFEDKSLENHYHCLQFQNWMQSVNEKLSVLTDTVTSLTRARAMATGIKTGVGKEKLTLLDNSDPEPEGRFRLTPQEELGMAGTNNSRAKLIASVSNHREMSSRSKSKIPKAKVYKVTESGGLVNLLPDVNMKPFFFQGCLEVSLSTSGLNDDKEQVGIGCKVKFFLERSYSSDFGFGEAMCLSVCFPKICNCQCFSTCPHSSIYFGRFLISAQLAHDQPGAQSSLVQKCYTIDAGKGSCASEQHLDCRHANRVVLDPHFCSFQTLMNLVFDPDVYHHTDFNLDVELKSVPLQVHLFQLKYVVDQKQNVNPKVKVTVRSNDNMISNPNNSGLKVNESELEKGCHCQQHHHDKCQGKCHCPKVLFKFRPRAVESARSSINNCNGEELEVSCGCIMANCSPLFKTMLLEQPSVKREIYVEGTDKETVMAFLKLQCEYHCDTQQQQLVISDWESNVKLNLELFQFAQEFIVPDLANITLSNLIVCPNDKFNLQLSLKLYSLGRKFQNCLMVRRANQLFGESSKQKKSPGLTVAPSSISIPTSAFASTYF